MYEIKYALFVLNRNISYLLCLLMLYLHSSRNATQALQVVLQTHMLHFTKHPENCTCLKCMEASPRKKDILFWNYGSFFWFVYEWLVVYRMAYALNWGVPQLSSSLLVIRRYRPFQRTGTTRLNFFSVLSCSRFDSRHQSDRQSMHAQL